MSETANTFDRDTLARVGHLMLHARRVVEGVRTGAHRSPLHGASVEFAEHKEYTPGDELRKMDWKLYGRSDKYYVKRFEEETNLLAYILLDVSGSMGFGAKAKSSGARGLWERVKGWRGAAKGDGRIGQGESWSPVTRLDYSALLAASLAYLLVGQGDAVGLYIFGGPEPIFLPPRTKASHLHVLMGMLASARAEGSGRVAQAVEAFAPRVTRRSAIFLISDLLESSNDVLNTLNVLRTRRNDVAVMHVMHPDELQFPYQELALFEEPEVREERLIADPGDIRARYLEEVGGYLERIRKRCFETQVDYMLFDMAHRVSPSFAAFLSRRTAPLKRRG